ncbi:MAG TPA: glycosyltransferase family 4 protein [Vicinamibacteria bacterium]|nr:glycosyltransferase family 4 protein [Vicinamibacteria bacterium]
MTSLRVLSLGFTRELWEDPAEAGDDSRARLSAYSAHVASYHVIVHSLRRHALVSPRRITPTVWAHATGGRGLLHSWVRMLALARRLVRAHGFDLVQSQDPVFTGTVGELVSRFAGLPHNVCVYGANPFDPQWVRESAWTRVAAPLGRRVLRAAHGVQVDGSRTARSLIAAGLGAGKVAVKPMVPHDLDRFFAAARDPSLRDELSGGGRLDRLVLFVGRLAPQKDVGLLLEAAAGLVRERPGLGLVLMGEGTERARLEEEAARRGLAAHVRWLGGKPHAEVARVMAACDLFCLPSRYEGHARVLMEAAAAALPIVSTDVSGSDDAVRAGVTGTIVPIGDASALRAAMGVLLADPARAREMGRRGQDHMREVAAREGSPRRQVEIWEELVRRYLGSSPAAGGGASPMPRAPDSLRRER